MGRLRTLIGKVGISLSAAHKRFHFLLKRRKHTKVATVTRVQNFLSHRRKAIEEMENAMQPVSVVAQVLLDDDLPDWLLDPNDVMQAMISPFCMACQILIITAHHDDVSLRRTGISMFTYCQYNNNNNALTAAEINTTLSNMPFPNATKDVIFYFFSTMFNNHKTNMLEANRILKIYGVLYIFELETSHDNTNMFIAAMKLYGFELMEEKTYDNIYHLFQFGKIVNVTDMPISEFGLGASKYRKCLTEH